MWILLFIIYKKKKKTHFMLIFIYDFIAKKTLDLYTIIACADDIYVVLLMKLWVL